MKPLLGRATGFMTVVGAVVVLSAGCGGGIGVTESGGTGAAALQDLVTLTIDPGVPPAEAAVIQAAAEGVGADQVTHVALGDPPDPGFKPLEGLPGTSWLSIEVPVAGEQQSQVLQDWQAARLAGAVRNETIATGLSVPFGYSIVPRLPDGSTLEPISIQIGSAPGTGSVSTDPSKETERLEDVAGRLGLEIDGLAFHGEDNAVVLSLRTSDDPKVFLKRWVDEVLPALFGERMASAWYVEIADADGELVEAVGNSPETGGSTYWIRPSLRDYWLELSAERGNAAGVGEGHGGARSSALGDSVPAAEELSVFDQPRMPADDLPADARSEVEAVLAASESVDASLQPGAANGGSRLLLADLGEAHASLFAFRTTKGNVCMVFTAGYGSGGCFARFSHDVPVAWDVRDVDEVGGGLPAIVSGIAPDDVSSVGVRVGDRLIPALLKNNGFFLELPDGSPWPSELSVGFDGGEEARVQIAPLPAAVTAG